MFIYKTTNLINGKIYIGQHNGTKADYIGSGKLLTKSIKKYGKENFIREILYECDSKAELNEKEIIAIAEHNSIDPKIGYNLERGGGGYERKENPNLSKAMKGKFKGWIFINKDKTTKRIDPSLLEKYIQLGWEEGKYGKRKAPIGKEELYTKEELESLLKKLKTKRAVINEIGLRIQSLNRILRGIKKIAVLNKMGELLDTIYSNEEYKNVSNRKIISCLENEKVKSVCGYVFVYYKDFLEGNIPEFNLKEPLILMRDLGCHSTYHIPFDNDLFVKLYKTKFEIINDGFDYLEVKKRLNRKRHANRLLNGFYFVKASEYKERRKEWVGRGYSTDLICKDGSMGDAIMNVSGFDDELNEIEEITRENQYYEYEAKSQEELEEMKEKFEKSIDRWHSRVEVVIKKLEIEVKKDTEAILLKQKNEMQRGI